MKIDNCLLNVQSQLFNFFMKFNVDIEGPYMEASSDMPIAAGIQTDLRCKAFANNVKIQLVWNCTDLHASKHPKVITHSTEIISTFTFMPSSIHNGINCSCTLHAEKYLRSTSIQLDVISK